MAENGHNPTVNHVTKSANDWHIPYVLDDPDFIRAIDLIKEAQKRPKFPSKRLEEMKQSLADSYAVNISVVNLAALPITVTPQSGKTSMAFDPATKNFTIAFQATATKTELLEEWERFERLRDAIFPALKSTERRRGSDTPQLAYAIFRALKANTDKGVFELYRTGKLPGYNGSVRQYDTYTDLMHYYNRYRPTKSTDS